MVLAGVPFSNDDVGICRIVGAEFARPDGVNGSKDGNERATHAPSLVGSILPGNMLPAVSSIPAMATDIRRVMAANVRRIRAQRGLSQEALADMAGVSVRYLGSIERGSTAATVVVLARLARALRVKSGELLE
jgi:ribosome-binding protein aMBF1 (putative translation factor)